MLSEVITNNGTYSNIDIIETYKQTDNILDDIDNNIDDTIDDTNDTNDINLVGFEKIEFKNKKISTGDYWYLKNKKILIFKFHYNDFFEKHIDIIKSSNEIIFSNYETLKCCIKYKNNFINKKYFRGSKFNKIMIIDDKFNFTSLTLGYYFNNGLCFENNVSLKYLTLGDKFNKNILLPQNLIYLSFGYEFNYYVKLPSKLKYLKMGYNFNQIIFCPQNLKQLTFGTSFNQPLELNNSLTHLTLGNHFNQPLSLNENLIYLVLGINFNFYHNFLLPNSLKILTLSNSHCQELLNNLPNSLEKLCLDHNFNLELNNLPNSIKIIEFKNTLNTFQHELNCLPDSIEDLSLPWFYAKQIKKIPLHLKKITSNKYYCCINDFNTNSYELEFY